MSDTHSSMPIRPLSARLSALIFVFDPSLRPLSYSRLHLINEQIRINERGHALPLVARNFSLPIDRSETRASFAYYINN
jgi:hypothetical protein